MDMLQMLMWVVSCFQTTVSLTIPTFLKGTMGKAVLPGILRKVQMTEATDTKGSQIIYSDIQRAFARLCLNLQMLKANICEETTKAAQFQMSLYSRTVFQAALWKTREVVNARDAECTSSGFFVGRPMANLDGTSKLRSFEVGLSKRAARKLGVIDGQKVLLGRFPNTRTLVVIVRIVPGLGYSCIGLPVGDLSKTKLKTRDVPTLLGGDADGDTYTLTAYHLPERGNWGLRADYEWMYNKLTACLNEIEDSFSRFWEDVPEYPNPECDNYTWKDEVLEETMSEFDMFFSKVMQKLAIGVVTNTILCLCIVKNLKSWLFDKVSWAEIRDLADRAIETVMDMKKGLGRNPMLISQLLMAVEELSEENQEELIAAGVDLKVMAKLLRALTDKKTGEPVNVRFWARFNKPMAAMLGAREAFEQFVAHYFTPDDKGKVADPLEFAQYFSDVLYGYKDNPFIRSGEMKFPTVKQSDAASDDRYVFRVCTLNTDGKMVSGTILRVNGDCKTVHGDIESPAVTLLCDIDTLAGKIKCSFPLECGGGVISLNKGKILLRDTVYVPYIKLDHTFKFGCGDAVLLRTWGEVMTALAFANFEFPIKNLKGVTDKEDATERFQKLIEQILNRLLAAYEIINNDVCSYATAAGQTMIVNLATKTPEISKSKRDALYAQGIKPASNNPIELAAERCKKAALYLKEEGLISNLCDTISGKPGMAFYGEVEDGLTFVMLQAPLAHFQSNSQRPKLNAAANVQPFVGECPPVYDLGDKPYAPSHPVWSVALPIALMDAFMISDAVSDIFKIKVYKSKTGESLVYDLEDGQKFQATDGSDLKGVGLLTSKDEMPWLKFADGTLVRAEVVFNMGSKSHKLLRLTHFNMVIGAIAKMFLNKRGTRMKLPETLTEHTVCTMGKVSGLYSDDDLTVTVLSADKSTEIGKFPAGIIHLGMHRQIPSVVTSQHEVEEFDEDGYGNSTESAGVKTGLMGYLTYRAAGLDECCHLRHSDAPPALKAEIAAMITAVEARPIPKDPEVKPTGNAQVDAHNAAMARAKAAAGRQ